MEHKFIVVKVDVRTSSGADQDGFFIVHSIDLIGSGSDEKLQFDFSDAPSIPKAVSRQSDTFFAASFSAKYFQPTLEMTKFGNSLEVALFSPAKGNPSFSVTVKP